MFGFGRRCCQSRQSKWPYIAGYYCSDTSAALDAINQFREQHGKPGLQWSTKLQEDAKASRPQNRIQDFREWLVSHCDTAQRTHSQNALPNSTIADSCGFLG
jgi:hypothetical protein